MMVIKRLTIVSLPLLGDSASRRKKPQAGPSSKSAANEEDVELIEEDEVSDEEEVHEVAEDEDDEEDEEEDEDEEDALCRIVAQGSSSGELKVSTKKTVGKTPKNRDPS